MKSRMNLTLRRGVLLFEVALVVLLVSIISMFLFRGYHVFLKSGRKSMDYLRMVLLSDQKMCQLQNKEKSKDPSLYIERDGDFDYPSYSWHLDMEDMEENSNLTRGILKVNYRGKRESSFDTIIYLNKAESNPQTQN